MPNYPPEMLEALAALGIAPTSLTPTSLVREYVNDLYRYELRRERERLRAGHTPKAGYHDIVIALRKKYWLLSFQPAAWEAICNKPRT
jgi:hypothetical protein